MLFILLSKFCNTNTRMAPDSDPVRASSMRRISSFIEVSSSAAMAVKCVQNPTSTDMLVL